MGLLHLPTFYHGTSTIHEGKYTVLSHGWYRALVTHLPRFATLESKPPRFVHHTAPCGRDAQVMVNEIHKVTVNPAR